MQGADKSRFTTVCMEKDMQIMIISFINSEERPNVTTNLLLKTPVCVCVCVWR